jgi:pimeloyl-ACP methyl ester carboxylesterase
MISQSSVHARPEPPSSLPPLESITLSGPTGDIAGIKIDVRRSGTKNGIALLCLHGIGSNSSGYEAQLRDLSDAYHVVAWDAPGYGRSTPLPWSEPRPESYADALTGLADALGLETMVVIGSSFGAVIAAAFAERYPARTLGVVLSAPTTGLAAAPAAERAEALNQRISNIQQLGPVRLAAERSRILVAPDAPADVIARATALLASVQPEGYIQAAHAIDMADTVAVASRLKIPVLVMVGTQDVLTPKATCAGPIFEKLRHGKIEVLEDVGHMIKLEAPQRFNTAVRRFIAGLPNRD